MPRKTLQTSGMQFDTEAEVPSTAGRKSNIPPALVDAVRTCEPKSYVVDTEDAAKEFRALVRQTAGLIGRQAGNPKGFGAKTAAVQQDNGSWRVYFQGRVKNVDEPEDTGDQE